MVIVYCSFQTHPVVQIKEEPHEREDEYDLLAETISIKEEMNSDPEDDFTANLGGPENAEINIPSVKLEDDSSSNSIVESDVSRICFYYAKVIIAANIVSCRATTSGTSLRLRRWRYPLVIPENQDYPLRHGMLIVVTQNKSPCESANKIDVTLRDPTNALFALLNSKHPQN